MTRRRLTKKQKLDVLWASGGRCHISGKLIRAGIDEFEDEHVIPLALGGSDELHNHRAALVEPHREKTKADVKAIARAKRVKAKNEGTWRAPRRIVPGSKLDRVKKHADGKVTCRKTGKVLWAPHQRPADLSSSLDR